MNTVLETIQSRRSIRSYLPEQISGDELNAVLEAALWAPSGHNTQPWHFLVIQDKKKIDDMSSKSINLMKKSPVDWIQKLASREGYHLFHNAPTVIVVSGRKSSDPLLFPLADCAAAIQNLLLAAESLNIGTCWIGLSKFLFDLPGEVESLSLPEGYHPVYSVALGYKKEQLRPTAPARKEGTVGWYKA